MRGPGLAAFTLNVSCRATSASLTPASLATVCLEPSPASSLANAPNDTTIAAMQTSERMRRGYESTGVIPIGSCVLKLSLWRVHLGLMCAAVSLLVDPPMLLADGELFARALPEGAQGRGALMAGALTTGFFWAAA